MHTDRSRQFSRISSEYLGIELERLSDCLADVLARLKCDSSGARLMAKCAGFPPEHLPDFTTPAEFWSRVVEEARNGRIGLRGLAEEALHQFPFNRDLHEIMKQFIAVGSHFDSPISGANQVLTLARSTPPAWVMLGIFLIGCVLSAVLMILQ